MRLGLLQMSKAEDIRYEVEVVSDDPFERMRQLNTMLESHRFVSEYLEHLDYCRNRDQKLDHLIHPFDMEQKEEN